MSDDDQFQPPPITDDDIHWATRLLRLPENAFYGEDGRDPRSEVLKCTETIDIAACPGSGKTTLLVAKLAILAEKWPHRTRGICVLSHTNAARRVIESKLGNTTAGRRLLSYPHFIGTIHAFVNEFLAIPWLRSCGYPVVMVDTAICESRRWQRLAHNWRYALEQRGMDQSSIRVVDATFRLAKKKGKLPFAEDTETYLHVQRACRETTSQGYHCYDDMFIWARDLIDNVRLVVTVLRDRLPLLFVDEAQDNSEEQSLILHDLFTARDDPVIRQRFGDPNQAIFSFVGDKGATTDVFPGAIKKELPNSHRFGQKIADFADPLGMIVPYELVGQGPMDPLASGKPEGAHTVFLFDGNATGGVLDAYAGLLLDTFSEQELRDGDFTAIGQVHRPPKDGRPEKSPHHVGNYWPHYDPELTKAEPKPQTFVQYVFAGLGAAAKVREAYPAVEKIAEGILRLAGMATATMGFRRHRHCHRQVQQCLKDNGSKAALASYKILMCRFAIKREPLTQAGWSNRWCRIVQEIAEALTGTFLTDTDAEGFLAWEGEPGATASTTTNAGSRDNVYRYSKDGKEVAIRVGSIHSVKGETHRATLVLDTFWQDKKGRHNLELLLPWLDGTRAGKDSKVQQNDRLRLHYVAMTRPTHLLCLAMKRSALNRDGSLDQDAMKKLHDHGWLVQDVP
jgi:hypothetical protein